MTKNATLLSVLGLVAAFTAATPAYAAPPNLSDAVVTLSASKSGFSPADNVIVHVMVTNPNPEAMHVLSYLIPTDGLSAPLFSVTVDGKPAPYLGPVAKRRTPLAEDYLTLAAGQSVGFDVNLSNYYSFAATGNYTIRYDLRANDAYAVNSKARASGWMQSNPLSVYASGRADPKVLASAPDAVSGPTNFTSCTADRQNLLTAARNNASVYANEAATYFGNNRNGARYVKWFGTYVASRWNTVKSHYDLIRTAVDTATVDFDCTCTIANPDTVFAYVFPNQPYRIHLCGSFWNAPATGTDSKAGTVIHEMSHFTILGGTDDFVYGQTNAMALAVSNPANAIMNADNHEYFAENTPATPDDGGGTSTVLENGVPTAALSGALNSETRFTITIPAGSTNLAIRTAGGSGDPDLFVRFGTPPTTSTFDCRSEVVGPTEQCLFATPSAGTYHVLIYGFAAYNGLTLTATWTAPVSNSQLQNGVPVNGLSGATGASLAYTIAIPSGASNLVVRTSGGSGDPDLYVRFGSPPTLSVYDCRSFAIGPTEQCTFATPSAGTYHVLISGFAAFSGMSLTATWQVTTGGGTDEPQIASFTLPLPSPAFANCPAGYFTAVVEDGAGAGLTPGIFGLALTLNTPGTQRMDGGVNFGGLVDGSQDAFAGFNFQNPANEQQRVDMIITGNPASSRAASLPVRIRLIRQPSAGVNETVLDFTATLSQATQFVRSINLTPSFYVVAIGPTGAASVPGGAADGEVYVTLSTQFVDRIGGGFFGGVVVGGYHAVHPFGGVSGFAGFCLGTQHNALIRVYSAPTYGATGARDLRLKLLDYLSQPVLVLP